MSNIKSNTAKAIMKSRRVERMRLGQESPDFHVIPSTKNADDPVRIALVPLTERELDRAFSAAAMIELPDNEVAVTVRDRAIQVHNLWSACRDPQDITEKAFDSVDEMSEVLEPSDVNFLLEMFQALVDETSPSIDGLSPEDLAELKKAFARIDLNALSGRSWAHLKLFFSTLAVDLRLGSTLSPTSISSLMQTSDENELIPGAETS